LAKTQKGDYFYSLGQRTQDQVFEQVRREKLSEYLGSAIGSKGLLALAAGAPGHHVLEAVRRYIRDHGQRRSQVEALIIAAAANEDPAAIQLVLGVARRHKQATVQAKAQELVEQIADRRGWSADELADRTIQTAGFEQTGLLHLDYGPRQFVGRVDQNPKTKAYSIELYKPDGSPIKALPSPASADDAELAKEARKQLSVSKKELKQVVTLQTSRLFEAMCVGRTWQVESWLEDVLDHPIMKHLLSSLVWVENPGTQAQRLFRPTVEGELIDADDESLTLEAGAAVGLAHAATVSQAQAQAWRTHCAQYGVNPLFEQFEAVIPSFGEGALQISDRRGWLSDSFEIRNRATKRGYVRAPAEDGAWFGSYDKVYTGVRIEVSIQFTGSYVPEEQIPAAVTDLIFTRTSRRSTQIPLAEVPPILLAESYRDYLFVAEGGSFDPAWETKAEF
jgi:hypothetical protein